MNNHGYIFEEWNFNKEVFSNLDATYILYLEGSPRIDKIKTQIYKYPPTHKVYLVRNPGYKNVNKPLIKQNSECDCAFSHYIAAKHALHNKYSNMY